MTQEFLSTQFDILALETREQPNLQLLSTDYILTTDIVTRIQEDIDQILAELENNKPTEKTPVLEGQDLEKEQTTPKALTEQASPPRSFLLTKPAMSPKRRFPSHSTLAEKQDSSNCQVASGTDYRQRSYTLPHSYKHSGKQSSHAIEPTALPQHLPTHNEFKSLVAPTQFNTLQALSKSDDSLERVPRTPIRIQDHSSNILVDGSMKLEALQTTLSSVQLSPNKAAENASTPYVPSNAPSLTGTFTSLQHENPMRYRASTLPASYRKVSHSKGYETNNDRQCSSVIIKSGSLASIAESDEIPAKQRSINELSLSDYATLNSVHFPKRIKVCKGFCSASDEVTISQGEVFDLHFIKHSKVVSIRDSLGVEYILPLSSTVRFSILYDPFNSDRLAILGFQYRTAGDIMTLKTLPVVIAAQQSYNSGSRETSVEEGEVLVVTGIKNTIRGRMLKVYSVHHGKKLLNEKCAGNFTTKSLYTSMSLSTLFQTSISFPQKAVLTVSSKSSARLMPSHLMKSAVTLKQFRVVSSVIATCPLLQTSNDEKEPHAIEIPIETDMEVKECEIAEVDREKFEENTRKLSNCFDPSKVHPYMNMPSTESHQAQCLFLTDLDEENKMYGIQTVRPDLSIQYVPSTDHDGTTESHIWNQQSSSMGGEEEIRKTVNNGLDVERHLREVEMRCDTMEKTLKELSENFANFSSKFDRICESLAIYTEQK